MSGLLLLKVGSNGSGSPPADPPVITITETSLSFPNTGVGQTSSSQSYDVSGVDLIADITVAAPAGYIINLDDSDDDDGPIVLPETAGVVNATTIYVKFKPGSSGNYNGSLSNSSPGAVTKNVSLIASAPAPTIMVSESSFSFANTIVGAYSASQSYVVSGQYLQGPVVITAPTGFIVNQDDSDTNTSPIILNPTAGTLGDTTIYVKFNPAAVQPYSTNIVNASLNASNINIAVSGIGTTPVINASVSSISDLEYHEDDGPSNESDPFRISGTGLTPSAGDLTVTPSTNIEIYNGSSWTDSAFTIAYTGGSLLTGFIYKVRLKAGLAEDTYSETVSISGGGATTKVIPVSCEVLPGVPLITLSESSFNFSYPIINGYSASQSYTVTGKFLLGDVTITAPTGFIINEDDSTNDDGPIVLSPDGNGDIAATTIYVRFNPDNYSTHSGNVTHVSTSAITKNLAVEAVFSYSAPVTSYMNALGIAANSTVYYASTPQERTGVQLWSIVETHYREVKGIGLINTTKDFFSTWKVMKPLIGGTAARHKINFLNPVDSDAAFRTTFVGGFTHNELGSKGNGTNGWAYNHLDPSVHLGQNSAACFAYITSGTTTGGGYIMGLNDTTVSNSRFMIRRTSAPVLRFSVNIFGESANVSPTGFEPFLASSRINSTTYKGYEGSIVHSFTAASVAPPTSIYFTEMGAMTNYVAGAPSQINYGDFQYGYTGVGPGFADDTEAELMKDIVEALQVALGREYTP